MEFIDLKANARDAKGKGAARVLRQKGLVPAILYGKNDPVTISVPNGDLEKAFKDSKTSQVFIKLMVEGGSTKSAMIKEYQIDPVSRNFLHVDFYEIDMDQKINIKVPVIVTGKSIGVEMGGLLQIIRRELEIRCIASNVPESIVLDITDLDLGDSIHVEDIEPPEGVKIPHEVNFTVVTIVSTKKASVGAEGEEGAEAEESGAAAPAGDAE